jgi:prepilin peptidase CpaA
MASSADCVQIAMTGLLGLLLLLLLAAAATDIRSRTIPNALTLAVAFSALLWWVAADLTSYAILARIACAAIVLLLFGACFFAGMMGGGDVKLLVALALWFSPPTMLITLFWTAIAGGILTLFMLALHRINKDTRTIEVPYGVAIVVSAVAIVANQFLSIAMR